MNDDEMADNLVVIVKAMAEYEGACCTSDDHEPMYKCGFCHQYAFGLGEIQHQPDCPVLLARKVMED